MTPSSIAVERGRWRAAVAGTLPSNPDVADQLANRVLVARERFELASTLRASRIAPSVRSRRKPSIRLREVASFLDSQTNRSLDGGCPTHTLDLRNAMRRAQGTVFGLQAETPATVLKGIRRDDANVELAKRFLLELASIVEANAPRVHGPSGIFAEGLGLAPHQYGEPVDAFVAELLVIWANATDKLISQIRIGNAHAPGPLLRFMMSSSRPLDGSTNHNPSPSRLEATARHLREEERSRGEGFVKRLSKSVV